MNSARNWRALQPEAIIVVGYGRIIPQWMIDLPRLGNINLHASLLPKYRGAAPIQWAIATGETVTGVTTMRIDAGLDTGDILLQSEERILPEDTALTLAPRLAQTGAELMIATLAGLKNGTITPRPQDDAKATLAPILKREDGLIDFSRSAAEAWNRLRGFQPWPGAFTSFRGKMLHIHAAVPVQGKCCCSGRSLRNRKRSLVAGLCARHGSRGPGTASGRQEADERPRFHQWLSAEEGRSSRFVATAQHLALGI